MTRLALGTAQWGGGSYGIANTAGAVGLQRGREILQVAASGGIDTIDTAAVYGESESHLGCLGVDAWRVVTKVPAAPPDAADPGAWTFATIQRSLARLRLARVHGVLLHDPAPLRAPSGGELYRALARARDAGLVTKIGVSVRAPEDLASVWGRFPLEIVQAPLSVFDRRLADSGWLDRLSDRQVEVHARSAFLQGLLVMPPERRPAYFAPWKPLLRQWDRWLAQAGLSPLEACLRFVHALPGITRVVVGVDTSHQLREVLGAAAGGPLAVPHELSSTDPGLVDPSSWTRP